MHALKVVIHENNICGYYWSTFCGKMSTRNKAKMSDSTEKISDDLQVKMWNSIQALTASVSILTDKVDQSTTVGEEVKQSVAVCLQTCQEALGRTEDNKKEVDTLKTQLNEQKLENAWMNSKLSKLENKLINIESQSRRDNLLVDGIAENDPDSLHQKLKKLFIDKLKLNVEQVESIKFVRVHRLGPKRADTQKPRTIIMKFHWFGDRMKVWEARKNLQGTDIYLNEDFPKEIQNRRRILRPILRKAKELEMETYLVVDALIIQGQRYTVDDLDKLPAALDPAKLATREVGDMLVFMGGHCPLSNFHMSDFQVNGIKYNCNEKFYARGKAEFCQDATAINSIMKAETPQECKRISDSLNKHINMKVWLETRAEQVMMKGVQAKFSQNKRLCDFLENTKDKTLVEANARETFWSCGLSTKENRKTLVDADNWPGKNRLGNILMIVRDELRK